MKEISTGKQIIFEGMPIPYREDVIMYEPAAALNRRIHDRSMKNSVGTKSVESNSIRVGVVYLGTADADEPTIPVDVESALMTINGQSREKEILEKRAPVPTISYPYCEMPKTEPSYYGIRVEAPRDLMHKETVTKTVGRMSGRFMPYIYGRGSPSELDELDLLLSGASPRKDERIKQQIAGACVEKYKKENNVPVLDSGSYSVEMELLQMPALALRVDGGVPLSIKKTKSFGKINKQEMFKGFEQKGDMLTALINEITIKDETGAGGDSKGFLSYNPLDFEQSQAKTSINPYTGMVEVEVLKVWYLEDAKVTPLNRVPVVPMEELGMDSEDYGVNKSIGRNYSFGGAMRDRSTKGLSGIAAGESKIKNLKPANVKVDGVYLDDTYFAARLMLGNPFFVEQVPEAAIKQ